MATPKKVCKGCKYIEECGDSRRTRKCEGYAVGSPKKHKTWISGRHV